MHRQPLHVGQVDGLRLEKLVHLLGRDLQLVHARPPGGDRQLGPVLLGQQADGGGLDAQRQVLGDDGDVVPLGLEVPGDREDPRVVVAQPEPRGQHARVRVVQFDAQGAAQLADRDGCVQPPVPDPVLVEQPQRLAGEVAELGVVAFGFQLGHHHDRQDHLVLLEAEEGMRVGKQHAGVEYVSAPVVLTAILAGHHVWTNPLGRGAGATASRGTGPGPTRRAGPRPFESTRSMPSESRVDNGTSVSKGPPGRTGQVPSASVRHPWAGCRSDGSIPSKVEAYATAYDRCWPGPYPCRPVAVRSRALRRDVIRPPRLPPFTATTVWRIPPRYRRSGDAGSRGPALRTRSVGAAPRSRAAPAGSPPGGTPTRTPRRSSTPNARSARA